jgi:hypothetical protein
MNRISGRLLCVVSVVLIAACGGGGGDGGGGNSTGATSSGCAWSGNCSTTAKEGSYQCLGNSLQKCQAGSWVTLISCSSLTYTSPTGFVYGCTCKGGCGTSVVECSYAFNICGSQRYNQPS